MTIETEPCPTCKGAGHVPKKVAAEFPVGSRVRYNVSWWKYPNGVEAEVIEHSKSGQRVFIKYPEHDYRGKPVAGRFERSYVTPKMLSLLPPI